MFVLSPRQNMKTSSELSAKESLDIITSMILEAKGNVQRNNFYFLLWGWIVVIANAGMYLLTKIGYEHPYIVWAITIPAWIFTIIKSFTRGKAARTSTHFDSISGWLWMAYGVTVFILVAFGSRINYQLNPVILLLSAIPTLVSGIILRFKPLIAGGVAFWIGGMVCFLVARDVQPLIGGATIVCGYLVPGYMLKNTKSE
jgi:hypothetical protein